MAVNNLNTPGVGIQPSIVDAKGDLIAGTAADAVGRLAVGTNGQVLVADSGETAGLKWNDPGSVGGLVHINTTSFSAVASQSVTNVFSATYRNYVIIINITSQTSGRLRMQLGNSGTPVGGTDYTTQNLLQRSTTVTGSTLASAAHWQIPGEDITQGFYNITLFQPFATATTRFAGSGFAAGSSGSSNQSIAGAYDLTTSFSDFFLVASTGTLTGTVSIYGCKEV